MFDQTMSIFTIKRHLLFLRVVCCLFILYNIQNANHHYYATLQSTQSWGLGRIVDALCWLGRFAHRNILAILLLTLINLACIVTAICAWFLKEWARKCLIVLFYITIAVMALQFLSDTAELYWVYQTRLKQGALSDILLYSYMYHQSVLNLPIFIIVMFWVIKQFKSEGMKELFKRQEPSKPKKM